MTARCAMVTGASGFIGRRLCAYLHGQRVEIIALHRRRADGPWSRQVLVDLEHETVVAATLAGVDVVYHLAGNAHALDGMTDAHVHQRITVAGTRSLLAACTDAGVRRVVFVSTSKAVGEPGARLVDESFAEPPNDAYGAAKRAAEELVLEWGTHPDRHAVVLRPPLVMGPGVKANLRRMLLSVRAGTFPPLPEFGNKRSLVHVDDLITTAVRCAEHSGARGQTFFVCHPRAYSTREMAHVMRQQCGRQAPRFTLPIWGLRILARLGDLAGVVCRRRMPFDSQHLLRLAEWAYFDASRLQDRVGVTCSLDLSLAVAQMLAEGCGGTGARSGLVTTISTDTGAREAD